LGNYPEARVHYREALTLATEQGETAAIASVIEGTGSVLIATGEPGVGVELFGVGHTLRLESNTPLAPVDQANYVPVLALARELLGQEYEHFWENGLHREVQQVVDWIMSAEV
jgi:hypothetical protein